MQGKPKSYIGLHWEELEGGYFLSIGQGFNGRTSTGCFPPNVVFKNVVAQCLEIIGSSINRRLKDNLM